MHPAPNDELEQILVADSIENTSKGTFFEVQISPNDSKHESPRSTWVVCTRPGLAWLTSSCIGLARLACTSNNSSGAPRRPAAEGGRAVVAYGLGAGRGGKQPVLLGGHPEV